MIGFLAGAAIDGHASASAVYACFGVGCIGAMIELLCAAIQSVQKLEERLPWLFIAALALLVLGGYEVLDGLRNQRPDVLHETGLVVAAFAIPVLISAWLAAFVNSKRVDSPE